MLLSILPSGLQVPKGRSAYGWQFVTNKWSCCFALFDQGLHTWSTHLDFSTLSTTDDFSKWWSAFWNFSVIFRKLYLSRTVRNFPHGDLAVFTVLLPASSFSSLLFSFLSFFFTIFQQNYKDNKCSRRMSSNQGVWQRIYKKGATKALCATNKQSHEQ